MCGIFGWTDFSKNLADQVTLVKTMANRLENVRGTGELTAPQFTVIVS